MNFKVIHTFFATLEHEQRYLFSLVMVLLLLNAIIHIWPEQKPQQSQLEDFRSNEIVFIEQVINTSQQSAPPAPPLPHVPQPVPNDEVIEEEIDFPEIDDLFSEDPLKPDEDGTGRAGVEGELVSSPEKSPSILHIVEPTVPDEAKRAGIKAEIIVDFLVDTNGRVEEIIITEIRLYEGDKYRVVNSVGHGILEAVSEAALKWRFRPAMHEGEAVKTYVKNSFSIGF